MSAAYVSQLLTALGQDKVALDEATLNSRRHDYWMVSHLRDRVGGAAPRPACVVRPTTLAEVQTIVRIATAARAPLVTFGLGSGVVGGVLTTPDAILLDLGGLNRTRFIDPQNLLASFDAGKNGMEAEHETAAQGLTTGHWPQSIAVSSVGGWIATRASGQFSSAYGNIEDIVYALEAVMPDGELVTLGKGPRASAGPDLRHLLLGSEGALGVITGVTLSLRRAAPARALSAFAAPDMRTGFDFQREIVQTGWRPPVVRQYDERESRRLHEAARNCTVIMVHEGPRELVDVEKPAVAEMAASAGLSPLPETIVEHWLENRNHVAGWDQLLSRNIVADTVEISAQWDRIAGIYDTATAAVGKMEGCLAASAHSSHVYRSGLNLYFTFAVQRAEAAALEGAYFEAWRHIMEATVKGGGSVAHHHGVGRVRRDYLEQELNPEGLRLLRSIKKALDPTGVMNPGALLPDA
jgi:alkyldihydroxyacetonephosphate synthase